MRSQAAMKSGGALGDRDHVAVRHLDVGDRGADRRQFGGHVLEHLGRADELGRFVQRERQQADVPAGQELGQLVIGAGPCSGCWRARQVGRVDLDHRADQHDLPVRTRRRPSRGSSRCRSARRSRRRSPGADAAMASWSGWLFGAVERLAEMLGVDAAREAVGVGVAFLLGVVQARAAGEAQVGDVQQRALALQQLLRRRS